MSDNFSEKSSESLSKENLLASQTTQNKSQKLTNTKTESKEINIISNNNSENEDLPTNKHFLSSNNMPFPKIKNNDNNEGSEIKEINNIQKKRTLAMTLSPLKKGKKRNYIIDLMEKSKKNNNVRRRSVVNFISENEIKFKEEIIKVERKDAFGVPINKKNKKKVKVTFRDTVNNPNNEKQLVDVINIMSFKKFNYIEGLPKEEDKIGNKSTCKCCLIN